MDWIQERTEASALSFVFHRRVPGPGKTGQQKGAPESAPEGTGKKAQADRWSRVFRWVNKNRATLRKYTTATIR